MKEIAPIVITDKDTGAKYTLEFTRQTAIFTDQQGFRASEFEDRLTEMLPILFYGSFRKNHREMTRAQTDELLFDKLGGLDPKAVTRLAELYGATRAALINEKDEEELKNARATVEL